VGFVVTRPIPYLLHLPNRWTNGRGVFRWKLSNFIKNEPTFYTQPTLSSKAGGFLPPCRCEQKVPKKTFARNWAVVETARTSKWCLNESGWVPNISATSELWNKKVGSVLQEHFSDLGILGVVKKKVAGHFSRIAFSQSSLFKARFFGGQKSFMTSFSPARNPRSSENFLQASVF